jgi:mannose-6-phosphate isomerase-like protein (cupin superfamily)
MTSKTIAALLFAATALPLAVRAQTPVGSNAYVDMYFGDWHNAKPRTQGPLTERDVFTKGDAMQPTTKGAILRYANAFVFASLAPGGSTPSESLSGKQQVFYFTAGEGSITAGGDSVPVSLNVAVLVPANLAFTIKNTGSQPLEAYVITEPTPAGFTPRSKLVVKDEGVTPILTTTEDWSRVVKPLFTAADGLATLTRVETVELSAMTITRPYVGASHNTEQLWLQLSGTSIVFIGPYLRRQTPGMAYEHPPDDLAPTSSLNYSEDSSVKFLLVETDAK